jgi:hypothetical protein
MSRDELAIFLMFGGAALFLSLPAIIYLLHTLITTGTI